MRLIIILTLVGIAIVALAMILRPSGPRVTTIEHRREEDEKDRDDA